MASHDDVSVLSLLLAAHSIPHLMETVMSNLHLKELKELSRVSTQSKFWAEKEYSKRYNRIINEFANNGVELNDKRDEEGKTLLWKAASEGELDLIIILLDKGAKVGQRDLNGFEPIHIATVKRKFDAAKLLVEYGNADIHSYLKYGITILHIAAISGNSDMISYLISKGADVNQIPHEGAGGSALSWASSVGHIEAMTILLKHGADVNKRDVNDWSPIHSAAADGQLDAMKILLENGAHADQVNRTGYRPIHLATETGQTEAIKMLLDVGNVDIESKTIDGDSALTLAAKHMRWDLVKNLTLWGADANYGGRYGSTALHWAASRGHSEVLKFLLERGANVESVNKLKCRPLHVAAQHGHLEQVKILLQLGNADINAKTRYGETAYTLAKFNRHIKLAEFLSSYENA